MAGVGDLERDVGAGMRQADDEDGARAELGRIAIVMRVQLPDRRVELGGERRDIGLPERPGRDDDLACREAPAVRGRHDEAVLDRLDPIDARPAPDRQVEPPGVHLEVVGHLASGRPVGRRRGEAHTRQRVVAGGAVQPERIPAVPPVVADARVGVEDREGQPALREVIAGRQSGLAGADDDRVEPFDGLRSVHGRVPLRSGFGGDRIARSPIPDARGGPWSAHRRLYPNRVAGGMGTVGSDQAVLVGEGRRSGPGRHVELGEDVADVPIDGPLADRQGLGDRPVRQPGRDEPEDLGLARAQATGQGGGVGPGRPARPDPAPHRAARTPRGRPRSRRRHPRGRRAGGRPRAVRTRTRAAS